MNNWLLSPVATFSIILLTSLGLSYAFSGLAYKKRNAMGGMKKPYACGEDVSRARIHPDYSQFFPFAFFFTFLHVIALVITTVPTETFQTLFIAVIYILGAIVGLTILFRG
ncbi:MAG: hypothetical protein PHN57_05600 [Candidatus Omnitrophica bacterium]|nr:hypothetical protein [Candidatus Omnitrophota bacterium]